MFSNLRFPKKIIGCFLCFVIWWFFPFLSIILFSSIVALRKYLAPKFLCILISLSFGLVAYTLKANGEIETDMMRYYDIYLYYANLNALNDFIVAILLQGDLNLLFQIFTFLISRLFPSNPQVFAFFWVTITYYVIFLTCFELQEYYSKKFKGDVIGFLILATTLGIVSFYQVTELVKQSVAISFFGYSLVRKLNGKKAFIYLVISCLLHFSSFFLIPIYFFVNNKWSNGRIKWIFIACVALGLINILSFAFFISKLVPLPGNLAEKILEYTEIDNWEYAKRYHFYLFVMFITVVLHYNKKIHLREAYHRKLFNVIYLSCCFIVLNFSNLYNYLRYTLTYYPFYLFGIFTLIASKYSNNMKYLFYFFLFSFHLYFSVSMLYFRTQEGGNYSNSYMNNSLHLLITSSVTDYFNFRINR